jgi:hypothetical protein
MPPRGLALGGIPRFSGREGAGGRSLLVITYWSRVRPGATAHVRRLARQLVQGDVEVQHVYPWLAEDAEVTALGVLADQRLDGSDRQVPCRRDPVDLDVRVLLLEAADGRGWKYCGSGLPLASTNSWQSREDPTTLPL